MNNKGHASLLNLVWEHNETMRYRSFPPICLNMQLYNNRGGGGGGGGGATSTVLVIEGKGGRVVIKL